MSTTTTMTKSITTTDPWQSPSHFYSEQATTPLPLWVNNVKLPWCFGTRWWLFLHSVCLLFGDNPSEADQAKYSDKIYSFIDDIPCKSCHGHASKYVAEHPPDVTNRRMLFTWSWLFHNTVNARLGKETVSFDEALRRTASPLTPKDGAYADNVANDPNAPMKIQTSTGTMHVTLPTTSVDQLHTQITSQLHVSGGASQRLNVSSSNDETCPFTQQLPSFRAPRTVFLDAPWGALEWMLMMLACVGTVCLLFCAVRAMRSSCVMNNSSLLAQPVNDLLNSDNAVRSPRLPPAVAPFGYSKQR